MLMFGSTNELDAQGNLTLGENLADSGVIQAYRAWKSASNDKLDFSLPGLNFTQCVSSSVCTKHALTWPTVSNCSGFHLEESGRRKPSLPLRFVLLKADSRFESLTNATRTGTTCKN
jgi:hypothetical protein